MRKSLKIFLSVLAFFCPLSGWGEEDPFEWNFDASRRVLEVGGVEWLEVSLSVPSGYFLYRDKLALLVEGGEGFELGALELPPSVKRRDPFFGKEMDVYLENLSLRAPLRVREGISPGDHTATLLLGYQGCSEGYCYRQMRREIVLPVTVVESGKKIGAPLFLEKGIWLKLGLSFLGGVATDFTPCVLPIIPITLAFIGVRRGRRRGDNLLLTGVFVVAMAVTYAFLGLLAALLGKSLGFFFQNLWFLAFVVLLYLVLSLSLFGLFDLQLPLAARNWLAKRGGRGVLGALVSGVTIGFLAAPCVGPLIASLLLYVAQQRELMTGFVLLLAYGLGMGSLFLVVSAFIEILSSRVHGGSWTLWFKRVLAVLMLLPAFYYGSVAFSQIRSRFSEITVEEAHFWIRDPVEGFRRAAREGRPILIDFYATWCLPCLEMERTTFADPKVQEALDRFIPIKVDCTSETPVCREMVERFGVVGWPTVMILSPEAKALETVAGHLIGSEEMLSLISRYSE